jgi:hypothetical protein
MFRVSHRGQGIDDADTIESAREIARGQEPGRYDIDEILAEAPRARRAGASPRVGAPA